MQHSEFLCCFFLPSVLLNHLENAAKFSAEGLTVNGAPFKGAAAAPVAKKDDKSMPAAAPAPAPAKKDDKPMTAADKKAAEKAEKDAAKAAAKAEKAAMAAKPAASAAKPVATVASAAKK